MPRGYRSSAARRARKQRTLARRAVMIAYDVFLRSQGHGSYFHSLGRFERRRYMLEHPVPSLPSGTILQSEHAWDFVSRFTGANVLAEAGLNWFLGKELGYGHNSYT